MLRRPCLTHEMVLWAPPSLSLNMLRAVLFRFVLFLKAGAIVFTYSPKEKLPEFRSYCTDTKLLVGMCYQNVKTLFF
jgi:hypothetical protein